MWSLPTITTQLALGLLEKNYGTMLWPPMPNCATRYGARLIATPPREVKKGEIAEPRWILNVSIGTKHLFFFSFFSISHLNMTILYMEYHHMVERYAACFDHKCYLMLR